MFRKSWLCTAYLLIVSTVFPVLAQEPANSELVSTGYVTIVGEKVAYRIRHLPVSSFPDLPSPIAATLNARGCLIPQTYEARRPENVVHGSFERPGSRDWAVLCSAQGQVSLMVFFASASAAEPMIVSHRQETERLQPHDSTGVLGFNWGIDPASPKRVHDALAGMAHRPPPPDHDSIEDSAQLGWRPIFHVYRNGVWEEVDAEV